MKNAKAFISMVQISVNLTVIVHSHVILGGETTEKRIDELLPVLTHSNQKHRTILIAISYK